jgi:hypothetical protein
MQSTKRILRVERRNINYLQSTIESYDGVANVSTLEPRKGRVEVRISPGCEDIVFALFEALKEEGFMLFVEEPCDTPPGRG